MKIAYIIVKGMPFGGGVEKYTEEIGARLAAKGHEVTVYAMRNYGAKNGFYKGMKIKTVPTIRNRSFEKITASLIATIKHCFEDNGTDIVHYHAFGPAMFSLIPRLLGRKVVTQGHGLEWKRSRWGFAGRLFLRLSEIPSVKFPNKLTVVSQVQQRYLRERYGIDSINIPTGVNKYSVERPDLIKQYGLQGNDYILFAARLVREKGVHYLIEAYNRLKSDVKLVIAGDAKHEEKYKSELNKLSGGNRDIIFTGFVTGKLLRELFSNCFFFVLPSEIEGLPTVLLEAMSYGNCCLVSDIPENLEALNSSGYTFKNKDVNDLTEKMAVLINNREAVEEKKERAKKHVLGYYAWDNIALQLENLYEKLLH
ncbi:glycosyltransferase [candidate division WS5 bacterium]|uniref:Glycosyltransferase n=1 Tax=candidate division WS5 bacterium TaxID=2093353 RepID=A0A419DGH2_9BACT|nr:MAG: glycosyltransferase [candidate division WS5 bacterium]